MPVAALYVALPPAPPVAVLKLSDAAVVLWTELVDLHRQRGEVEAARLLVLRLADARSASKRSDDVAAAQ